MPVFIAMIEDPYTKEHFRVTIFRDTKEDAIAYLRGKFNGHKIITITEKE